VCVHVRVPRSALGLCIQGAQAGMAARGPAVTSELSRPYELPKCLGNLFTSGAR
jgi:hypothetical protein